MSDDAARTGFYFAHEDEGGDGRYHVVVAGKHCQCKQRGSHDLKGTADMGFVPPENMCEATVAYLLLVAAK